MILTNQKLSEILDNGDIIYIKDEVELLDFLVDMQSIFETQDKLGMDVLVTRLTIKGYIIMSDTIHLDIYHQILDSIYEPLDIPN
jgi:hypothetical protein